MAVPAVIAGVAVAFQAIGRLSENPIMAWLLVVTVLMLDAGQASLFGNAGAVGSLITWVVGQLGFRFLITSQQTLVVFAFSPILFGFVKFSIAMIRK